MDPGNYDLGLAEDVIAVATVDAGNRQTTLDAAARRWGRYLVVYPDDDVAAMVRIGLVEAAREAGMVETALTSTLERGLAAGAASVRMPPHPQTLPVTYLCPRCGHEGPHAQHVLARARCVGCGIEIDLVAASRLTRPMRITLFDCHRRRQRVPIPLFPGGQWRLIRHGLYARWLTDDEGMLTEAGSAVATWLGLAQKHPGPEGQRDNPPEALVQGIWKGARP